MDNPRRCFESLKETLLPVPDSQFPKRFFSLRRWRGRSYKSPQLCPLIVHLVDLVAVLVVVS